MSIENAVLAEEMIGEALIVAEEGTNAIAKVAGPIY